MALGKFGLWKEDIKVKYFLDEGKPEKLAADCIVLLDDEPSPPEIVEIHNGTLKSYGKGHGIVIDKQGAYKLKIDAVIDDCLKRYLQDTFPIEKKSVQFILHWQKNKNSEINQVIHSLFTRL